MPTATLDRFRIVVEQSDDSETRRFRWIIRESSVERASDRTLYATKREAHAAALPVLQRLASAKANGV